MIARCAASRAVSCSLGKRGWPRKITARKREAYEKVVSTDNRFRTSYLIAPRELCGGGKKVEWDAKLCSCVASRRLGYLSLRWTGAVWNQPTHQQNPAMPRKPTSYWPFRCEAAFFAAYVILPSLLIENPTGWPWPT